MADTGFRGGFPLEIVDYIYNRSTDSVQNGLATLDKHYKERIEMIDFDVIHAHTPFTVWRQSGCPKTQVPDNRHVSPKYYEDFIGNRCGTDCQSWRKICG